VDVAVYVVVGGGAFLAAWVLYASLHPVEGVWRREDAPEELVLFEQFGPFVTGKRNVEGGNHQYSGVMTFSRLKLSRRDFGIPHLISVGFPESIAKKINGSVMASITLHLASANRLEGLFSPQKILFDEPSVRVMSRDYQMPVARNYVRTDLRTLPPHDSQAKARGAALPPPPAVKKKRGNTF
jgi:hypothetical protein